jgi:hypothetical protein
MASNDAITQRKRRFSGRNASTGNPTGAIGVDADRQISSIANGIASAQAAWYPDQLLPFSLVLNAINDYGHRASMAIHGVEIMNSGSGISIDDINIDESMTFVATEIDPWRTEAFQMPGSTAGTRGDLGN